MDEEEEDVDTSFGGVLPSEMRIAGPSLSDPSPVDGVFGSGGLGESALILQTGKGVFNSGSLEAAAEFSLPSDKL